MGSFATRLEYGSRLNAYHLEEPAVLNSYLSMVRLIAMLMTYAMNLRWGDPLGALVMFPFIAQKGIQILLEEGKHEYVED